MPFGARDEGDVQIAILSAQCNVNSNNHLLKPNIVSPNVQHIDPFSI